MAIASVRYRPNAGSVEESKAGFVVVGGTPHDFHYWHFRTKLKFASASLITGESKPEAVAIAAEKRKECIRQIVENLKGEALSIAMQISVENLFEPGAEAKLIQQMLTYIFPIARHESKDLYREWHKTPQAHL